jgi:predicted nucleotidyltransferase
MDGYVYHAFCSGSQLYFFGIDEYNMPQQEWCCMQRDNVLKILAEHRDELHQRFDVKSLALFGSVARGEATETSDVDLLVEFERPVGLFHFFTVQHYLEDILGVAQVDLVMPDALHKELKEGILREAIHAT